MGFWIIGVDHLTSGDEDSRRCSQCHEASPRHQRPGSGWIRRCHGAGSTPGRSPITRLVAVFPRPNFNRGRPGHEEWGRDDA